MIFPPGTTILHKFNIGDVLMAVDDSPRNDGAKLGKGKLYKVTAIGFDWVQVKGETGAWDHLRFEGLNHE